MAVIPELEKLDNKKSRWSKDEIDTLKRYGGKVSAKDIQPYLNNRSISAINGKLHDMKRAYNYK